MERKKKTILKSQILDKNTINVYVSIQVPTPFDKITVPQTRSTALISSDDLRQQTTVLPLPLYQTLSHLKTMNIQLCAHKLLA